MNLIGGYVRLLREAGGYSQRKLGKLSGISNSTISRIENGLILPNPDTLKKMSVALSADYREMLYKTGYLEDRKRDYETGSSINGREGYVREIPDDGILELMQKKRLDHIRDGQLKDWIYDPENIEYLKLAKKISDLDIEPEYVLNEFICKIFRIRGKGRKEKSLRGKNQQTDQHK